MATKNTKKTQKTKTASPALGLSLLFIGAIIIVTGLSFIVKNVSAPEKSDRPSFEKEYTLIEPETNIFVTKTAAEIEKIFAHGTGIVFLGFPECAWCQAYVPMLNDLARSYGIEEISYYNIRADRENNTEFYQKLITKLGDRLQYDNAGDPRIYVPNAAFIIDGEIIGNDYETSKDTLGYKKPEEYWTDERVAAWQDRLRPLFEQLKATGGCVTTCNE